MTNKCWVSVCALVAVLGLLPRLAVAQPLDEMGNRASAMGAFVAVADDASATLWNPAGLINGPVFNILLDFGRSTPANRSGTGELEEDAHTRTLLAVGLPPFGVFYSRGYHPAVQLASGRKDSQVSVRSMVTSNLGATVLHSIVDGFTVGATFRLVHGGLKGDAETSGDVDAGAMLSRGRMRVGIAARNLATPTFGSSSSALTIERHVRAGVAWGNNWPGISETVVSVDADLTRVANQTGDRRDVAVGAERWFRRQTIALRGGVRASTVERARPVASVGGSYAVRSGVYVDVAAAGGRDADARWSVSARLMF